VVSSAGSVVEMLVIPTDEEAQIARHCRALAG
jgi:acetate kinase